LPLRITEVGSAVCGGISGQSNTLAVALWAPDMLFSMVAAGVTGINIHLRGNGSPNSALAPRRNGIYAQPLFYGMSLFARTLGPGARLLRISRHGQAAGLNTWAVRLADRSLRMLCINKSDRAAWVTLRWSSPAAASLVRLSAPSIHANKTVTLAGQRL